MLVEDACGGGRVSAMDERERKRQRRFVRQHSRCAELRAQLEGLYSGVDSSFLWDTTKSWLLVRPSNYYGHTYVYVGRRLAEHLFGVIMNREAGQHMQVLGAKGTGKSTVMCTIAGFLHGSKSRRVVYLHAKRFVDDPFDVLLDALLLSCWEESQWQELSSSATLEDLVECCEDEDPGALLFIVDDWDRFELSGNETFEKVLKRACSQHMLVKLSSVNSRSRQIWSTDDKAYEDVETVFFDGPFETSELKTWTSLSSLNEDHLQHVDRLTGGMPRLLLYLEQAKGNERDYTRMVNDSYVQRLYTKFMSKLTTAEELIAALDLVSTGELNPVLAGYDMTSFYKDRDGLYHMLSPYMRMRAQDYLMTQDAKLKRLLCEVDMQTWVAAVRINLDKNGNMNPARVGWNVEGLVIACMRFRRKVFAFEFKHYRTYKRGEEKDALNSIPLAFLQEGVLLGPAAFNEKAVDVIYIKLEASVLVIKGIQITVAQWKAKAKKESHKVWATEILPKWKAKKPSWTSVSQDFYYVMPESVVLADIPNTKWKKLRDVDDNLAEFDALLLDEPKKTVKHDLTRCSGNTRAGARCANKAFVADGLYYCSQHGGPS